MIGTIDKIRGIVQDDANADGKDSFDFESSSSSKVFVLSESNVLAIIAVYKNGSLWSSSNYIYSLGRLTITGTLTAGDNLQVDYSYYPKYSDNEIVGFIKGAIAYLSTEQYVTFIVGTANMLTPAPTEAQENLLALIAIILMKGDVVAYRTPELTISFERSDPKEKKIKKLVRQFNKNFGVLDYVDLHWNIDETYTPAGPGGGL